MKNPAQAWPFPVGTDASGNGVYLPLTWPVQSKEEIERDAKEDAVKETVREYVRFNWPFTESDVNFQAVVQFVRDGKLLNAEDALMTDAIERGIEDAFEDARNDWNQCGGLVN
ncbi:hypothetical protein [Achromobacter phage Motura]|uniref:Uncharacterized protein n=1 Tax=Achromobacter phage Motura TaxID=2591403 RepID=A0A514CSS8_9CAUD|nr:hypothetical protein H1O15_gp250 [Achromobacter phage Motura]QDH83538.1 hypothetical protein [Achromobacter phage Motura]